MIAFARMLVDPAEKAGIKVPDDPNRFNPDTYPHWFVFTQMQLGASMPRPDCHWDNAEVVAQVPEAHIRSITPQILADMGFAMGRSIP